MEGTYLDNYRDWDTFVRAQVRPGARDGGYYVELERCAEPDESGHATTHRLKFRQTRPFEASDSTGRLIFMGSNVVHMDKWNGEQLRVTTKWGYQFVTDQRLPAAWVLERFPVEVDERTSMFKIGKGDRDYPWRYFHEFLKRLEEPTWEDVQGHWGWSVGHADGDPTNNRVENLVWVHPGTPSPTRKQPIPTRPIRLGDPNVMIFKRRSCNPRRTISDAAEPVDALRELASLTRSDGQSAEGASREQPPQAPPASAEPGDAAGEEEVAATQEMVEPGELAAEPPPLSPPANSDEERYIARANDPAATRERMRQIRRDNPGLYQMILENAHAKMSAKRRRAERPGPQSTP